jgi:hypothetical protein
VRPHQPFQIALQDAVITDEEVAQDCRAIAMDSA